MSNKKHTGLTRRSSGLMALEQRFMFDGAALDTAVEASKTVVDPLLHFVVTDSMLPAAVITARAEAEKLVLDFLSNADARDQLFAMFNGGQSSPSAQWVTAFDQLIANLQNGGDAVRVELRSATELQNALGAFAAKGVDGAPVIYLNADYVRTASAQAIEAVLIEEFGHAIDSQLNPNGDSLGDEGHAFASLLLTGNANLAAVLGENDHQTLQIDGQQVAVEEAGPYSIAQVHFVPLPESNLQTAQQAISSNVSGNENTVIAITATANNTIIVYDQWEDGYEADINNPVQSTTQIWGDGDLTNGVAPGFANDIILAGQTIVLQNQVSPALPLTVDYDGRDKIGSTQAVSVVRAGWSQSPGTVLAGAVSVIDAGNAGTDYIVPIGQDVNTVATGTNALFEYTSLHIIATQDNTTINLDLAGDGTFETTVTLAHQGDTYFVNGGVMAGAHITANKGIGVYAVAGDVGSAYENRWFALTPTEQWSSSYYAPVSTTLAADPSYIILYNPNPTSIDVYYDTATTTGNMITVSANTTAAGSTGTNYVLMPASAAHFYTRNGSKFYAVGVIDADATSNATHDWSYSLVPESYLTTKFVVGWAPGYDGAPTGSSLNGSPVWITATDDTTIYIDNGASITLKNSAGTVITGTAVSGSTTGAYAFDVMALQSYRAFDTSDKNQSGLTVYTTDGTLITAAWGEDPSIAGAGTPYLDMGTTVLPFPDYVFDKTSVEASPITYTGASDGDGNVEVSEQIEYTLTLTNRAVIDLYNINIKDALNAASANAASYVANSTTIKIIRADGTVVLNTTAIADDASGSPLDLTGYTLTDADPTTTGNQGLKRGDQVIIKYRVQVGSDMTALAAAGFTITNDATMNGDPAGGSTGITRLTSNQTIVNVNGTVDGQVFITDSSYNVTSTFNEGATIGVKVVDNDANRSITVVDTLHVTVTNTVTGETEDVTLTETGVNTGIFRNTLTTSIASSANNSGALQFRIGDSIKADYTDPIYGVVFDSPTNPGVAGDSDGNIATGNANTAYASIAAPSATKILYLSDDSTNNLDRNLPPSSDTTAATTGQLVTTSASTITINDNFGTSRASYTAGSGWSSGWTEVSESDGTDSGDIKVSTTTGTSGSRSDYALYIRATGAEIYRNFTALSSAATLTLDIKDSNSDRALEDGDYISVQQQIGGNWTEVTKIYGTNTSTTYATQTLTLSAGATGIKFVSTFATPTGDGGDRVYIDNVKIATGTVTTASTSGTTDFALSASAPAGQTFSFSASSSSSDAIAVDAITLSLKKTGTTTATATVSIRNAWDGTVLWFGTVSTSSLSTTYRDVTLSPTGLKLDKSGSYVIRVDSSNSGIVWQGGTSDTYASGTRLTSSGTTASGDLRFSVNGHETGMNSVTFTQSLTMATDFIIPAGGVVKVVTYVTNESALVNTTGITATLTADGSTYTADTPVYDSTVHTLTWSFTALGSAKTIHAGQSVGLKITNASTTSGSFKIAYDSYATPSRIELPTTTVITLVDADPGTAGVQEVAFFNNAFANGGSAITSASVNAGDLVYIRFKVSDPFGDYDISSLDLTITSPTGTPTTINMANAYVVNAASDGRAYKTYEYAWQTTIQDGTYNIGVVAHEGTEGTVTDTAATSLYVAVTDLGTPSKTMFRTGLAANSGVEAGAVYDSGATAYLRVTDLDKSGTGTVTAIVSDGTHSYTVTLTEIGSTGIFEANLGNAASHVSNDASQSAARAIYFATLPNGTALTATYTDANDSTDTSSDAIVVNTPPTAVDNSQTIDMDKQATGNVITDDNNGATAGGVDTDSNLSQTLTVTAVNGVTASVGDTITLPSGARLLVNPDGTYIYDPSSLTTPPTSGSPVTDSFTYTISDGQGGTSTATVTLTVNYVNPIVIDNQSSTDGQVIELDVSNKFADITYADFVYSVTNLPSGLSIDPVTGIITGTIAANASTSSGSHDYSTASVTVTELDANGGPTSNSTIRSFHWVVTNVTPTAVNDAKSTAVSTAVNGYVLTNDSDGAPDNDTLTVTKINGTDYTSGSVATTHGAVTLNTTTGAYTYTPTAGYTGADSFTYTISDGQGGTSTATVNLNIVGVNSVSVNEGSPYAVFTVSGTANQQVSLALANGTATLDANGIPLLDGSEDYGPAVQYSTDNGANWSTYGSSAVALNSSGSLLVRTTVINDTLYEGAQTFTLNVTDVLGASAVGTATIHDDGTGQWFDGTGGTGSNTAPNGFVLNDDRPSFSINDVTVNEAAGTMTFTVTKTGSTALASSVSWATADDSATAGADYTAGSGTLNFAAGVTSQTITINIANDGVYERSEALKINLSAATAAVIGDGLGVGTIRDDGMGDSGHGGSGTGTNDDRTLSVNNISVNEGSPYGVFTVSANIGETLTLALNDGSAGGSGADYGTTGSDGHVAMEYSTDGGSTWTTYTIGFAVPGTGVGVASVLVRTSVTNDSTYEGAETLTLDAAYTSGLARSQTGTATIHDDGTGQWFDGTGGTGSNTAPNGSVLDDDRLITVAGGNYNENSPRAVFTVNATAGQLLTLDVQNAAQQGRAPTGDNEGKPNDSLDNAPIYYSLDGGATWHLYNNTPITAGNVPVLVAVDITNERDDVYEGEEQLKLVVTSGGQSASAFSSIFDDGTGDITSPIDPNTHNNTGANDPAVVKDDDRPKADAPAPVLPPAQPPAPLVVEPLAPEPVRQPPQVFNSALAPVVAQAIKPVEPPAPLGAAVTSVSGHQIPVSETAAPGLSLYQGVTDQFVQSTQAVTKISLPFDAFIHSDKNAIIRLQAKQSDDSPLPKWVQFDPASGTFEIHPPKGFKGKLDLKVIARDDNGREAVAMFQMFVGEQVTPAERPQSRSSFTEKLRMAGKRPVTLVRVAEGSHKAHDRALLIKKG